MKYFHEGMFIFLWMGCATLFGVLMWTILKMAVNPKLVIAHLPDGTTCLQIGVWNCGASLGECSNGMTYRCVQNVQLEEKVK